MIRKIFAFLCAAACFVGLPAPRAYADTEKWLCVYYPNWAAESGAHQRQQPRDLPWDRLSIVNHAFWRIQPNADKTAFPIVSANPEGDLGAGGNFAQYEELLALYPQAAVLISVGGWNDTRWFSAMAATEAGRRSFIDSCVETLTAYPFLGGIDIDWEYPGTSRNGEGEGYVGGPDDEDNFTALMREMRARFDASGMADKRLTYCAPTYGWGLQTGAITMDFAALAPYTDRVNIMTYDMAGGWNERAAHHSALYPGKGADGGAAQSADYMLKLGVPPEKINIGSPLYTVGWTVPAENGAAALGQPITGRALGPLGAGSFNWFGIKAFEGAPGWETGYDAEAEAGYMYNNDPASPYYQHFYSYESERSVQAKLDYINAMGLGGLIVWDTSGDAMGDAGDFPMITRMAKGLGLYDGDIPVYTYVPPQATAAPFTVSELLSGSSQTQAETQEETAATTEPTEGGLFMKIIFAALFAFLVATVVAGAKMSGDKEE